MSTDTSEDGGIGRRDFARQIGAGAVAVGGTLAGAQTATQPAKAHPAAIAVGAAAVGWYAGGAMQRFLSDDIDAEKAFEKHLQIYNEAREINEVVDETLLASIERDAEGLMARAREQAIVDIYNVVVDGGSETDAESAAEDAINRTYSIPKEDLATRINSLLPGIYQQAYDNQIVYWRDPDDQDNYTPEWDEDEEYLTPQEETKTFWDGTQWDIMAVSQGVGGTHGEFHPFNTDGDDNFMLDSTTSDYYLAYIEEPDPEDYDLDADDYDLEHVDGDQRLLNEQSYLDVLVALEDAREDLLNEMDTLIDTHYDGIEAGDLSLQDLMSPEALSDTIEDADSYGELALYFRQLGLAEAEGPVKIEIELDSDELEGSDYEGTETVEMEGIIGWTIPSEVDDTTLPIGESIDPSVYPGEFRMAAEYDDPESGEDEVDMISLVDPFEIVTVDESVDGSDLEFDEREVVEADTDPDEAQEIFIEHREAEETAHEVTLDAADDGGISVGDPRDWFSDRVDRAIAGLLLIGGGIAAVVGAAKAQDGN